MIHFAIIHSLSLPPSPSPLQKPMSIVPQGVCAVRVSMPVTAATSSVLLDAPGPRTLTAWYIHTHARTRTQHTHSKELNMLLRGLSESFAHTHTHTVS